MARTRKKDLHGVGLTTGPLEPRRRGLPLPVQRGVGAPSALSKKRKKGDNAGAMEWPNARCAAQLQTPVESLGDASLYPPGDPVLRKAA